MVNNYIRDLSENRLISVKGRTNRTMSYNLTSKGIREKMSLLISYNLETTSLYMDAKKNLPRDFSRFTRKGFTVQYSSGPVKLQRSFTTHPNP